MGLPEASEHFQAQLLPSGHWCPLWAPLNPPHTSLHLREPKLSQVWGSMASSSPQTQSTGATEACVGCIQGCPASGSECLIEEPQLLLRDSTDDSDQGAGLALRAEWPTCQMTHEAPARAPSAKAFEAPSKSQAPGGGVTGLRIWLQDPQSPASWLPCIGLSNLSGGSISRGPRMVMQARGPWPFNVQWMLLRKVAAWFPRSHTCRELLVASESSILSLLSSSCFP